MFNFEQKFKSCIRPYYRRILALANRAVVTLVDDAKKMQIMQVKTLSSDIREDVERMQEYGFTSHPHPGAEAAAIFPAGIKDHGLIIAVDDRRYRLKGLEQGEVAIYTDEGDKIHLKRGNEIEVQTNVFTVNASTKVQLNTPLVYTTGEIKAEGEITDLVLTDGLSMSSMRDVYNSHVHPENDNGGPTDTPSDLMD